MLKQLLGTSSPSLSLLLPSQSPRWSHQRLLGISSQLVMLVLAAIIITHVVIKFGTQKLQQEWATQAYSELQTLTTELADTINFQKYRTLALAQAPQLNRYINHPSNNQLLLQRHWQDLLHNMPDLTNIALYDLDGQLVFQATDTTDNMPLSISDITQENLLKNNEIYSSPIVSILIKNQPKPFIYQLTLLKNQTQTWGYLVTYNDISPRLNGIKFSFNGQVLPLILLDNQGFLFKGEPQHNSTQSSTLNTGMLTQDYAQLWRNINSQHFGQFYAKQATYVYLKLELSNGNIPRKQYYLLSYISDQNIATIFKHWQQILILGAVLLTLFSGITLTFSHRHKLEQRSRLLSIELSHGLFNTDTGWMIVADSGRIIKANKAAAQALHLVVDELEGRSLQLALEFDDANYQNISAFIDATGHWQGEIDLTSHGSNVVRSCIRKIKLLDQSGHYLLVNIDNIAELAQARNEANLYYLMSESDTGIALLKTNGNIIKCNSEFLKLMQFESTHPDNFISLLNKSSAEQWPKITEQLSSQGQWQGLLCYMAQDQQLDLQSCLKTVLTPDGEIQYVSGHFYQADPKSSRQRGGELIPLRSKLLTKLEHLENYFKALAIKSRHHACLLLIDITPKCILSHMNDIHQLESRQQQIEIQILKSLPLNYQMCHWQLGKIIIVMPDTASATAYEFSQQLLEKLQDVGLSDGVAIGIAANQVEQSLDTLLRHAETALRRAKQTGEQNICQAFTRA